jgi:hypothetical protein
MRLLTAHKILIGAALALALLLTARSAFSYASTHAHQDLAFAGASVVLAVLLAVYLRAIWHR